MCKVRVLSVVDNINQATFVPYSQGALSEYLRSLRKRPIFNPSNALLDEISSNILRSMEEDAEGECDAIFTSYSLPYVYINTKLVDENAECIIAPVVTSAND